MTPIANMQNKQTLEPSNKTKGSLHPIFEMLDLFYANKHMYDRLQNRKIHKIGK